jgi:hypothetical protein
MNKPILSWEVLANNLLDYLVEYMGLNDCVKMLLDLDYTEDQLYFLGFDKETIDQTKEYIEFEKQSIKERNNEEQ